MLASLLHKVRHGVRLNQHLQHGSGLTVFQHACKLGAARDVSRPNEQQGTFGGEEGLDTHAQH